MSQTRVAAGPAQTAALLAEVRGLGVVLTPDGDELRVSAPPGVLAGPLVERLRAAKLELLAAVRAESDIPKAAEPVSVLSFAQERMWLQAVLHPEDNAYNLPLRVDLVGRLRPAALRAALAGVVERHEVLRTRYRAAAGRPRPVVDPAFVPPLPLIDLAALAEPRREAALEQLAAAEARRPFDLAKGPVLRALLVRLGAERHCLMVTRHHIAGDGWSLGILLEELSTLYLAGAMGTAPRLAELPIQYGDFAAWQRARAEAPGGDERLERWVERLRGADYGLGLLAEPAPGAQRPVAQCLRSTLPAPLVEDLRALARQERTTLFTVLLSAFASALHRIGGQSDLVIGSPAAGRTRTRLEPLIGSFVTMLPLRLDLSGRPTVGEVLRRSHPVVQAALEDQETPTEQLVERLRPQRTLNDNPLFAAVFALQNLPQPRLASASLMLSVAPSPPVMPKFAVSLTASAAADGGLELELEYDPGRLAPEVAEQVSALVRTAVEAAVAAAADREADLPVAALAVPGIPAAIPVELPADAVGCLPDLVAAAAAAQPDAIAVSHHGQNLSYRALLSCAGKLAAALQARGAGPETLVGLCLDPSIDLVVAALAILRSGAGYLPMDPSDPLSRRSAICSDAGVGILVTHSALTAPDIDRLDADAPAGWTLPAEPVPGRRAVPDNVAYTIYTSGSTGTPKGVVVTHANISALIAGTRAALPELGGHLGDAHQTWSLTHSPAFDVSVFEMWGALTSGGRLVIPAAGLSRTPDELWTYLAAEQVTVLSQTPSAFGQLAPMILKSGTVAALHTVLLAGEACQVARLAPWFELPESGRPALVNLYGTTETTVHAMVRTLVPADAAATVSPIGGPIPGQVVAALDEAGAPVPVGGRGDLHVGGVGLARGYLGRPGLTASRFVPASGTGAGAGASTGAGAATGAATRAGAGATTGATTGASAGARWYRTGDQARQLGRELGYLGRVDNQVKLRGYRIEPGEVEAALLSHPGVAASAVVLRADESRSRLVGYVVADPAAGTAPDERTLRDHVAQRLPRYMVPAHVLLLEELPLTRNGKTDRARLAELADRDPAGRAGAERPSTPTEQALTQIVAGLLGCPVSAVGVRDSLFELGGDSLTVTQLHARIVEDFRIDPPVRRVYQALDIASLAAAVDTMRAERERDAILAALAEVGADSGGNGDGDGDGDGNTVGAP